MLVVALEKESASLIPRTWERMEKKGGDMFKIDMSLEDYLGGRPVPTAILMA